MNTLFSVQAAYTVDTSSLLKLFKPEEHYYKGNFKSLWEKIEGSISSGEIISHIQVFEEIMQWNGGEDELAKWAKSNKHIFADYEIPSESDFIKTIGTKYPDFLSQGKDTVAHADPWLVSQAHNHKLKVISDESPTRKRPPSMHIVCKDFGLESTNLLGLIQEKKWVM